MNPDPAAFVPSLAASARTLASRTGRRRRALIATRLVLITLAAVFGAFSFVRIVSGHKVDYAGVAAVVAFIAVLGIRVVMVNDRELDTAEIRAAAVAEIVTSHAWRYAMAARPYALATDGTNAAGRSMLLRNLSSYHEILLKFSLNPPIGDLITAEMAALREVSIEERRDVYLKHRIAPLLRASQVDTRLFSRRDRWLFVTVLIVELLGIPAGAVKAFDFATADLLGVVAAAASSLAVWAETLKYPERVRGARTVAITLPTVSELLKLSRAEHDWALLIGQVEDQLTLEYEAVLSSDTTRHLLDARVGESHTMTPEEYFAAAQELRRQIWDPGDRMTKLEPDVLVGVNPGGAILGGMLYFLTRVDFLPLTLRARLSDDDLKKILDSYAWPTRGRKDRLSILVVDASIKSGESMAKALALISEVVESKGWSPASTDASAGEGAGQKRYMIRTAVITKRPLQGESDDRVPIDYHIDEVAERFPYGSI